MSVSNPTDTTTIEADIAANTASLATKPSLTITETEVFSANSPGSQAWTDLDLSGTIGAKATLVVLKFKSSVASQIIAFRKNGDTDEFWSTALESAGCALAEMNNVHGVFIVATDTNGVIEWKYQDLNEPVTIDLIAYMN